MNVAVIGVGNWGYNHARIYRELASANLVAVVDKNPKKAAKAGGDFNVKWYTDIQEMFEKEEVEAVSIATPTKTHVEIALLAIENKKHLLIEKPITEKTDDALKVVKEAEKNKLKLMVGHVERFNPGVKHLKEFLDKGEIGKVLAATAKRLGMQWTVLTDVGVIKDLAIHDIDLIRYLLGDPVEVFAYTGKYRHSYEDYAYILLKINETTFGFIEVNWLSPSKVRKLTVTGSNGLIHLD